MRLFSTHPHGEHAVVLLEDASKPVDRIYEIRSRYEDASAIRILGSELASLSAWWAQEQDRRGVLSPEDEEES